MAKAKNNLNAIKSLREKTSASINDVRSALEASGGDEAKALEFLRQRGAQIAEKRQGRSALQGRIEAYIHHDGRLGALVEINCETDFVARNDEFKQFCRDLALQVAAMGPRYIRREDVPAAEAADPETLKTVCLLEQPFVKDQKLTVGDLLKALVAKTGENVIIRRISRFGVGDGQS
jgi:elongation factor Ts